MGRSGLEAMGAGRAAGWEVCLEKQKPLRQPQSYWRVTGSLPVAGWAMHKGVQPLKSSTCSAPPSGALAQGSVCPEWCLFPVQVGWQQPCVEPLLKAKDLRPLGQ